MSDLTQKQRDFCHKIAGGASQSEAYRSTYNTKKTGKALSAAACITAGRPKIAAYIAELRAQQDKARFLTREIKRQKLAEIVESKDEGTREKIKAIEVDNLMTGDNAPQEVNVFGLGDLLTLIRKKQP